MRKLKNLFENNKRWAERTCKDDPEFFKILSMQQNPEYLWIGCSDSRVPANEIVDLMPGELFVHRNVANVVVHTDHNCLSVMQYAVEVLKVKHIMVVGHYGCGGVQAVLKDAKFGLIDNWLRHVGDVKEKYTSKINALAEKDRLNSLIELNVIEQVRNVCRTNIVQEAWQRGQELTIHGWVYGLANGHLHDLESVVTCADEVDVNYKSAGLKVFERYVVE
ncbi:carbonate dehydratase [Pseudoalteromonas sp. SR44-5]|jgi:carbonic anhydrase|uniref:Carbonic anhydrase n=2 Tax=Pseudoalteromonas TaxID=53246 RepID=A0ABY3FDT5_9GAMM|nr:MULTISPECIES: carbonate dehydratase [Pseudoalteromonas]MBB1294496.1 carbonate dehydratase [Pseudoalteromonas sp. SR41-4]MBB1332793.1 carbonate dehydratase [Pseudoalteromonas sp. SR41-6]MBB1343056.1 carbonate dehydratase [Pseudoalteromonas sp. SR45-6]MBB1365861.1 carbonate dehydratase [Pseudoalteromonas sp. SR44-5]MBB1416188.1 carbonate dehydratase [Pseudoalteromonas sp. SG44-1]|tara:strand:- start:29273 stop:29932 length:660 start_codon:yes stop_codon:yes gene_type:complete